MTIIDVSKWQGVIDWQRVRAAGVQTAIMRATLGSTGVDVRFAANWIGSAAAAIPHRGVYHYIITGVSSAGQVDNILRTTGGDFGDEPLTLDCERTAAEHVAPFPKAAYTALVREMLDRLAGIVPVRIYTSAVEWAAMTTLTLWAEQYVKWLAHYNNFITAPALPPGVSTWARWQYSSTGKVDGIAGNVDMNRDNPALPQPPPTDPLTDEIAGHAQAILGLAV